MVSGVIRGLPYADVDLTKLQISRRGEASGAIMALYAQINKWCEDTGYPSGLRTHSFLINKLMYFSEKEIQKKNAKFRIDTGWYLYGPCYEAGRMYEVDQAPISIVPISEKVSNEVGRVCEELVPLFAECSKRGPGGVRRDFLSYIYSKKCDHDELCEYYMAKHAMQCKLWEFGDNLSEIDTAGAPEEISKTITLFDKALLNGEYSGYVGLEDKQIGQLVEFTPVLEEYARMVAEGSASRTFFETINAVADVAFNALAHLNYSTTFESFNANHTKNVRKTHRSTAEKKLRLLELENHRLLDAYGKAHMPGT